MVVLTLSLECSEPLNARERKSERDELGLGAGRRAKRAKRLTPSPPPPILSCLPFCSGVQFFRDSIRAFNYRIRYEEIEGCEQSTLSHGFMALCVKAQ